jgi:beta-glucuronidase
MNALLGWVHELGGNYVRLAHYPHDERMTRLADRMGILVWSEIPVYWAVEFDNPAVLVKAEQQLHEMIRRDRDKASIVLWSVANETPVTPARVEFLKTLECSQADQWSELAELGAQRVEHSESVEPFQMAASNDL